MKTERELLEYFIDKKFRVGDIIKINKKVDQYNHFYTTTIECRIYPPYFSGKIGRIIKIITEHPKYEDLFSVASLPINRIIEERLLTENKLYMVSLIMPMPKTKAFLIEVIGILTGDEIILANKKEMEIYRPMEENYIAQLIAEDL
jgi:hypothetical protein